MVKRVVRAAACWLILASPSWAKDNKFGGGTSGFFSAVVNFVQDLKEKVKDKRAGWNESREEWQSRQEEKQAQHEQERQAARAAQQAKNEQRYQDTQAKKADFFAKKEQQQREHPQKDEDSPKKEKNKNSTDLNAAVMPGDASKPRGQVCDEEHPCDEPAKKSEDPAESKGSPELVKKSKELSDLKDLNEKPDVVEDVKGVAVGKPVVAPPRGIRTKQDHPALLAMSAALGPEDGASNAPEQPTHPTEDESVNLAESQPSGAVNMPEVPPDPVQQKQGLLFVASARTKIEMKDYWGAIEASNKAIKADPTNPESYVRRAEANISLKLYDEAKRDILEAIKVDPNYANAYKTLAFVTMRTGAYREAAEASLKALALNPQDADSHALLAQARDALGDWTGAERSLAAAASLNPKYEKMLREARRHKRIYSPSQDSSLTVEAGARGGRSPWRLPLLAGALLAAAGAVFLSRKKTPAPPVSQNSRASSGAGLDGKYEDLRVIGRGGMGTVYEAIDRTLGRPVAIKKVSEDLADIGPQAREMLLKEARTVASLDHPAIVEIYEIFEEGTNLYVVFELVKGKTVAQLLAERGKLGLKEILNILRPVCEALQFAHNRRLVHRDLKPANIMVTELGQVKLMDFGIARSVSDAAPIAGASGQPSSAWLARTKTVAGTPAYMAPEAEQGLVSSGTDIYALGVCLYELATGRPPFPPEATVLQRLGTRITPPSEIDPALAPIDALSLQALEPEPFKRPQSAAAFLSLLEASVQGQSVRLA